MNVVLNGAPAQLPDDATVAAALAGLHLPDRGVAVALNAEVIPRSEWAKTPVPDGARLEIVQAVQGG